MAGLFRADRKREVEIAASRRKSARELSIGTSPKSDFPVPRGGGTRRAHARIVPDRDGFSLIARGPVRIHGQPVRDVRLHDGDLIQVGRATLLRVHIAGGAIDLERAGTPAPPHGARLSIARVTVATIAFAVLIATAAIVVHTTWPRSAEVEDALAVARSHRNSDIASERRHNESRLDSIRIEVDRQLGEVQRSLTRMDNHVDARIERAVARSPELIEAREEIMRLAAESRAAERVIADAAPAVCVVQGAYAFGREIDGEWRFLRRVPAAANKDGEEQETLPLSLDGTGEIFKVEYSGTGFLADRAGVVLTNRHIAQPWWNNEAAEPILEAGFSPRFIYLRAYFPGRKSAVRFTPERSVVSESADVAAILFDGGKQQEALPRALELASDDHIPVGRRVVMLGYPTGLSALLARGDEEESRRISTADDFDPIAVLDGLAAKNLVRPLPTQGHVNDLLPDKLLFDAATEVGGSGAPVLNLEGRVVAINYGILKAFSGTNFGVPIRFARPLLERARTALARPPAQPR